MTKKFFANLMLFLAIAIMASSCVSTKKHKSLKLENERLKGLMTGDSRCQRENDELRKSLRQTEEEMAALKAIVEKNEKFMNTLTQTLTRELKGYSSQDVKVEIRDGKAYITFANKMLYQSGSPMLDDKGKKALRIVAEVLRHNPDINILVEGHADNQPIRTNEFRDNWDLSVARASNVVRELVSEGVKPARLTAAGRGEFQPVASNSTENGRQLNRRTEIIISPNLNELLDAVKK